jgi:hypothetical protein
MVAKADCILAACHLQLGAFDKATELYNSSINVFTGSEDTPMERNILLGQGFLELIYESLKSTPDYRKPLQGFLDIDVKRSHIQDPYLLVYNDLAYAESLRLAGFAEKALTRFHEVIKTSNKHGYRLEKAHALLGVAATKLLIGEADRQSCIAAKKLYQKVGSAWGQGQALIIHAMIENEMGEVNSHLLQQAIMLARTNSLSSESQLIKNFANQTSLRKETHVLLFLQSV